MVINCPPKRNEGVEKDLHCRLHANVVGEVVVGLPPIEIMDHNFPAPEPPTRFRKGPFFRLLVL